MVPPGVGSFAVQLAKHHGAYVIGTAARKDEAFARGLGLDEFIDYRATRFEDQVREVDLVFATVGGEVIPRSFGVMKSTGRLVTFGPDGRGGRSAAARPAGRRFHVGPIGGRPQRADPAH